MSYKLDIALFVGGMEINPDTLKTKSLGGSETAGVSMAHALAKRGHHVNLFCSTKDSKRVDDVNYMPLELYEGYAVNCPHDVHIVQRVPGLFHKPMNSKVNILWQHDLAMKRQRSEFVGALWNLDKVFCMSKWQIEQYKDITNIDCDDLYFHTTNGIILPKIDTTKTKRNPKQLVYTNRPERGLDTLLFDICPQLWAKDKDIEIVIAGYDNTVREMEAFYNQCYSKIAEYQQQGYKIKHVGALTKVDLYKLYQESKLFVYPTQFEEISCITAMETQMNGLPMVTTHTAALPETLGKDSGVLLKGDIKTEKVQKKFVKTVIDLIQENSLDWTRMQKAGIENAKQYDWNLVAEQWEGEFLRLFEQRAKSPNRNKWLLEREDIVTLKHALRDDLSGLEQLEKDYEYIESSSKYELKYKELGKELAEEWGDNTQTYLYPRVELMLKDIGIWSNEKQKPVNELKIIDFASGVGNESILMANTFNAEIDAINISEEENNIARRNIAKNTKNADISVHLGSNADFLPKDYDVLFMGEILEHQAKPWEFLDNLEQNLKDDSLVVFSVPFGLWDDKRHAHLWNFERYDLATMLSGKDEVSIKMMTGHMHPRTGTTCGWWVVSYRKTGNPCNPIDLDRKMAIINPPQSVSLCMITRDAEDMLHRTLKSVDGLVDEIIIADNGSTDSTKDIAQKYNAQIVDVPKATEVGFDFVRNESIKNAKGDWILWLDADEELLQPNNIIKYLRPNIFNGYSLKQHHFATEQGASKIDLPIRLFRNRMDISFCGFVHEHPELGENLGVGMSTILADVDIAHDGYLHEEVRRKRFTRNIDLMIKDYELHPNRLLTCFLMLRDWLHIARYELEQNNKQHTPTSIACLDKAIDMFRSKFLKDANLYQDEAVMFYSECLHLLGQGIEFRYNINAGMADTQPTPQDTSVRFKDEDEFLSYLACKVKAVAEPYTGKYV